MPNGLMPGQNRFDTIDGFLSDFFLHYCGFGGPICLTVFLPLIVTFLDSSVDTFLLALALTKATRHIVYFSENDMELKERDHIP